MTITLDPPPRAAGTRRDFLAGAATLAVLGMPACGDGEDQSDSSETRTVTTGKGAVRVPARPERIVVLSGGLAGGTCTRLANRSWRRTRRSSACRPTPRAFRPTDRTTTTRWPRSTASATCSAHERASRASRRPRRPPQPARARTFRRRRAQGPVSDRHPRARPHAKAPAVAEHGPSDARRAPGRGLREPRARRAHPADLPRPRERRAAAPDARRTGPRLAATAPDLSCLHGPPARSRRGRGRRRRRAGPRRSRCRMGLARLDRRPNPCRRSARRRRGPPPIRPLHARRRPDRAARDRASARGLHRGRAPDARSPLEPAVTAIRIPASESLYVWIAGEAGALAPLRRWARDELRLAPTDRSITGYWQRGVSDFEEDD